MWRTVKLGDILQTGAGGTPLKSKKEFYEGGDIKWLLSGAVCERDILDSKTYITQAGLDNSSAKVFPKNTVLIAMYGATAGQVGILRTEAATNQAVCGIYPSNDYLPEFLYYYLSNYKETLLLEVSGVAQPNLSQVKIKNIPIPVPPLAEQQRIVAKLDAAFSEIDKAETVLVEKETGITNVFEAQVRRYFTENVLSVEYKKLSEVAEYFNGLTYSPKDVCDEGVIVLRSSNIQDGKIELSDLVRVKKKIREKLIVKPNDILICSRNGSRRLIGKSALIDDSADEMTFGTFMMIVRSELNEYLQWFFKSSLFKQQIAQGEYTAINQITRYMLDEVVLPIPSLVECKQVNEEINFLDSKVRDVLVILAKQRNELLRLKAAILVQELQPQQSVAA